MADGGNSGAAATAAPAAAVPGIYRYRPPNCVLQLMQLLIKQVHALDNARRQLEKERQNTKNYKAEAKRAAHVAAIAPTVLSELPLTCTRDDMVEMTKCEKAIADPGGMDEIQNIVKLCKDADERAARSKKKEADVVYPTPEQVASFTGESSSRARGSVDYCERRKNKRSRQ